ncbi:glucoside xylosyltransferase 1-like [Amblyomma americanum]
MSFVRIQRPLKLVLGLCVLCIFVGLATVKERLGPSGTFLSETGMDASMQRNVSANADAGAKIFAILKQVKKKLIGHTEDNATSAQADTRLSDSSIKRPVHNDRMTLVYAICKDNVKIGMNAIKSAVAYSSSPMRIVIFADKENIKAIPRACSSWPPSVLKRVRVDVLPAAFPKEEEDRWRNMFRPCATQRLFVPSLLPDEDAVIYADTDTMFMHPVEDLWRLFYAMNEQKLAAIAPETEDPALNPYRNTSLYPFVEPFGLNAGVMLMNLTRMRKIEFERHMLAIHREFGSRLRWADQDMLNVFFARNAERLFTLTCSSNFRYEHCKRKPPCFHRPVAVIHGSKLIFKENVDLAFTALQTYMEKYKLDESLVDHFIRPLSNRLRHLNTACSEELLKQLPLWKKAAFRLDSVSRNDRMQ